MDRNTKQVYSKSALHVAVGNNDIKSVRQHLLNGSNVNILDEDGETALCIAVEKDFVAIAEVLLMHGADPNLTNNRLALHVAVMDESVTFTKLLLKYGANPNLKSLDYYGDTALHVAIEFGFTDLAKILLAHNADPNLTNASGNSALHVLDYCTRKENLVALTLLLDYLACPDIRNEEGESALHIAVIFNNVSMVKKLLACGADPNSTNNYGDSIIHTVSSFYGEEPNNDIRLSIVKALLEAGVNVASTNKHGCTPLHLNPSQDVALCLLDKGAAVDVQDNCGQTPLHCSLFNHYHGNAIEPLLFSGANLDTPDQVGKTCIQMFGETYNLKVDIVLLKFAELNMKRKVTSRFDLNRLNSPAFDHCIEVHDELELMYDELEKVKFTNIEDICLYNVLKLNTKDLSYLHNEAFRTAIEGDDFKKEFPKFYLLTRMCVREAEKLKLLVEELSQSFALKLTTELVLNVPQEVCRLIIIELESEDIVNLNIALSC